MGEGFSERGPTERRPEAQGEKSLEGEHRQGHRRPGSRTPKSDARRDSSRPFRPAAPAPFLRHPESARASGPVPATPSPGAILPLHLPHRLLLDPQHSDHTPAS